MIPEGGKLSRNFRSADLRLLTNLLNTNGDSQAAPSSDPVFGLDVSQATREWGAEILGIQRSSPLERRLAGELAALSVSPALP